MENTQTTIKTLSKNEIRFGRDYSRRDIYETNGNYKIDIKVLTVELYYLNNDVELFEIPSDEKIQKFYEDNKDIINNTHDELTFSSKEYHTKWIEYHQLVYLYNQ